MTMSGMNSDPTSDQMQLDVAARAGQTGQAGFQPDAAVAAMEAPMDAPGQDVPGFFARAYDRVMNTVVDAAASVAEHTDSRKVTVGVLTAAIALPGAGAVVASAASGSRETAEPARALAAEYTPRKFKPCKDGKPKFQMRLLGPRTITETETPIDYELQAKSCKKRKGVEFGQNGWDHSQDVSRTTNMKARIVRKLKFQLIFPEREAGDGLRISITAAQGREGLYGKLVNFRYADPNVTEATGSTGATSGP